MAALAKPWAMSSSLASKARRHGRSNTQEGRRSLHRCYRDAQVKQTPRKLMCTHATPPASEIVLLHKAENGSWRTFLGTPTAPAGEHRHS